MRHLATKVRKIKRADGELELLGWTGEQGLGEFLATWYTEGADPSKWPSQQQSGDDWCRLIVVQRKRVFVYEKMCAQIPQEDPFMAWGSGRDFAMATLYLGYGARRAVEVANRFDVGCGMGVDVLTLED